MSLNAGEGKPAQSEVHQTISIFCAAWEWELSSLGTRVSQWWWAGRKSEYSICVHQTTSASRKENMYILWGIRSRAACYYFVCSKADIRSGTRKYREIRQPLAPIGRPSLILKYASNDCIQNVGSSTNEVPVTPWIRSYPLSKCMETIMVYSDHRWFVFSVIAVQGGSQYQKQHFIYGVLHSLYSVLKKYKNTLLIFVPISICLVALNLSTFTPHYKVIKQHN